MIGDAYLDTSEMSDYVLALDFPLPLVGLGDSWTGERHVSVANEDDGSASLIHGPRSGWALRVPRVAVTVSPAMGDEQVLARLTSDAVELLYRNEHALPDFGDLEDGTVVKIEAEVTVSSSNDPVWHEHEAKDSELFERARSIVSESADTAIEVDEHRQIFKLVRVGKSWRARANVGDVHLLVDGTQIEPADLVLCTIEDLKPYRGRVARLTGDAGVRAYRAALGRRQRALSRPVVWTSYAPSSQPAWRRLRHAVRWRLRRAFDKYVRRDPWPDLGKESTILAAPPFPVFGIEGATIGACGVSNFFTMTPEGVRGIYVEYGDRHDSLQIESERLRSGVPAVGRHALDNLARNLVHHAPSGEYWDRIRAIPEDDHEAQSVVIRDAPWTDAEIAVDGIPISFKMLVGGHRWVATGQVGEVRVTLRAKGREPGQVSLVQLASLPS